MNKPQPIVQQRNRLVLTDGERSSSAWNTMLQFMTAKRDRMYVQLSGDLDEKTTAKMRGQIELLNEMIRANEADPIVESTNL